MTAPRPHDLLFPRRPGAFRADGPRPGWLEPAAPLVVRREATTDGTIPVGARGLARNERCKGYLAPDDVARAVTPFALAQSLAQPLAQSSPEYAAYAGLPCIAALLALAPRLDALDVEWGPAGGAGYWLACALPVLRPTSDLDLVVRLPRRPPAPVLEALAALPDGQPCRIDVQIDTEAGGFALAEWLRGGRVLLKTDTGPVLVADPWERA